MRGEAGEDSITTPHSASPPTPSSSPKGRSSPPSGPSDAPELQKSTVPDGYRPRGAANPARTAHPQLNRHHAPTPHRRTHKEPLSMPMLQCASRSNNDTTMFMTQ